MFYDTSGGNYICHCCHIVFQITFGVLEGLVSDLTFCFKGRNAIKLSSVPDEDYHTRVSPLQFKCIDKDLLESV